MLRPLQQFICDRCGEVIQSPEDGYIEWIHDANWKYSGFKIIHAGGGCTHYHRHPALGDVQLSEFVGAPGIVEMLRFLDIGRYHNANYVAPDILPQDTREFVEVFRRLQIPYYEEARLYWQDASADGEFDGINEIAIFLPTTLERIVRRYSRY